jgi:DNA-binding NtrC family response regulator
MTDRTRNGVRAGRILIVDDEKAIREVIAAMLAPANYECREAASGKEALAVLESGEEFDLMLTDLMMSDLDGIALLERSKDKCPLMPVVIVTAVYDISVALATIRNGAQDYLLKPFERDQLLAVVRRALEDRRMKLKHQAYVSGLESQVARLTEQLRGRKS